MRRLIIVLPLVAFCACWRLGGPIVDMPSPFHGQTVGAYDRKAVPGVLIVAIWNESHLLTFHGRPTRARFVSTAVTDAHGKFVVDPPKITIRSPLVTHPSRPDLLAWKGAFAHLDTVGNKVVMWPHPDDLVVPSVPQSPEALARNMEQWVQQNMGPHVEIGRFPAVRTAIAAYATRMYPTLAGRRSSSNL
jgi:hypothetical protein